MSAALSFTRGILTWCSSLPWAIFGAPIRKGVCTRPQMGARRGRTRSSSMRTRGSPTSPWIR